MSRQEFSQSTKTLLAQRVGYHCSNPACGVATIGPSNAPNKREYVGVAAHIYSASIDTGPRAKPDLEEHERRSITNGIHLCHKCSTIIDKNNGIGYSLEILFNWKRSAEAAAHERVYQNRPYNKFTEVDFSNLEQQYATALTCTGLNEKNVISCPSDQNVVLEVLNKLNLGNKCILTGSSGSGKSLLTYQTAYILHRKGWTVFKINKDLISKGTILAAPTTQSLIIIDDAQTIETRHLENLLGSAHTDCILLANLNTSTLFESDITRRFPTVEIVPSAQMNMVRQFCMKNRDQISETLQDIGIRVRSNDFHDCIESRIKRAAKETTPWLFNYSLTEGWRIAKNDFYLLRDDKDLHLVLVTVAAFQYATLDLGVSDHVVISALEEYRDEDEWLDKAKRVIRDRCFTSEGKVRNMHYEYSRKMLENFVSEGDSVQGHNYFINLLKEILTSTVYERGHSNIIEFVMFEFPQCRYQLNIEGFTKRLAEELVHDDGEMVPPKINKLNSLIRLNPDVVSVLRCRDNLVENWILNCSRDTAYQLANFLNTLNNEHFGPLNGAVSLFDHLLRLIMSANFEDRLRYSRLINRMYCLMHNDDRKHASEKLDESEFSVDVPRFRTGMACHVFSGVVNNFYVISQSWADKQIARNIENVANLFNVDFMNALECFNELLHRYFRIVYAILGADNAPLSVKKHGRELTRRLDISVVVESFKSVSALQVQQYSNSIVLFALYNRQKLREISDRFDYAKLELLFSERVSVDHYHRALVSTLYDPDSANWRRHAAWVIESVNYVEYLFFVWNQELSLQRLRNGVRYEMKIHMCSDCEKELAILTYIFEKESRNIFEGVVRDNRELLTKIICARSLNSDDHRSKFDFLLFLSANSQFIIKDIFSIGKTCNDVIDKLERLLRGKKWERMIGRLYVFLIKTYGIENHENIEGIERRFPSLKKYDMNEYIQ